MKKSTKRFPINTEVANGNGFRVSTEGVDLSHFQLNPLLLWMHKRPKGESKDEILPLGYWEDIELKDGQITGVPVFDDEDDFAMKIYKKVENGSIRAASAGLKPIEFKLKDGEKWLEKSILKEASICDMGSNHESVGVVLYDDQDNLITLTEAYNQTFNTNKSNDMKLIQLSAAAVLPLLKLKEDASEAEAQTAISELVTLADTQKNQIETLTNEKEALTTEKQDLEVKLTEAEKSGKQSELVTLVNKAEEDRKITADQKPHYIKLGEADFDSTKALLDSMKPAPTVASQTSKGSVDDSLVKLSWNELDKAGKLVQLREENLESFKEKYKAKFGTEYKS